MPWRWLSLRRLWFGSQRNAMYDFIVLNWNIGWYFQLVETIFRNQCDERCWDCATRGGGSRRNSQFLCLKISGCGMSTSSSMHDSGVNNSQHNGNDPSSSNDYGGGRKRSNPNAGAAVTGLFRRLRASATSSLGSYNWNGGGSGNTFTD